MNWEPKRIFFASKNTFVSNGYFFIVKTYFLNLKVYFLKVKNLLTVQRFSYLKTQFL